MRLLSVLLLAVLPAAGATGDAGLAPITVYTSFKANPDTEVIEALQEEFTAAMAPGGLNFNWRSLENHPNEVSAEVVVVTFKGACDVENLYPDGGFSGALGWTDRSDGDVLPFANIDCDRVRSFLKTELVRTDEKDRDRVFGRALGRVLAHEIYHVLLRTTKHASSGLAKADYSARDLMIDNFGFQPKQTEALKIRMQRHVVTSRTASRGATAMHHGFY